MTAHRWDGAVLQTLFPDYMAHREMFPLQWPRLTYSFGRQVRKYQKRGFRLVPHPCQPNEF